MMSAKSRSYRLPTRFRRSLFRAVYSNAMLPSDALIGSSGADDDYFGDMLGRRDDAR